MTTCVVVCQMSTSACISTTTENRIKYVMKIKTIIVKDDYLLLAILYLYAFKQITASRYCSYTASLTYVT